MNFGSPSALTKYCHSSRGAAAVHRQVPAAFCCESRGANTRAVATLVDDDTTYGVIDIPSAAFILLRADSAPEALAQIGAEPP